MVGNKPSNTIYTAYGLETYGTEELRERKGEFNYDSNRLVQQMAFNPVN